MLTTQCGMRISKKKQKACVCCDFYSSVHPFASLSHFNLPDLKDSPSIWRYVVVVFSISACSTIFLLLPFGIFFWTRQQLFDIVFMPNDSCIDFVRYRKWDRTWNKFWRGMSWNYSQCIWKMHSIFYLYCVTKSMQLLAIVFDSTVPYYLFRWQHGVWRRKKDYRMQNVQTAQGDPLFIENKTRQPSSMLSYLMQKNHFNQKKTNELRMRWKMMCLVLSCCWHTRTHQQTGGDEFKNNEKKESITFRLNNDNVYRINCLY